MLDHQSVKQTEEYAITEQQSIGVKMRELKQRLIEKDAPTPEVYIESILRMEVELNEMKKKLGILNQAS